jgi:hypothetical protein
MNTRMPTLALAAALLMASPAWADLQPSWDPQWCGRKKLGDPCLGAQGDPNVGQPGTCQKTTCMHYDVYDSDPPGFVEIPCVRCVTPDEAAERAAAEAAARQRNSRYALGLGVSLALLALGGSWVHRRRKKRP